MYHFLEAWQWFSLVLKDITANKEKLWDVFCLEKRKFRQMSRDLFSQVISPIVHFHQLHNYRLCSQRTMKSHNLGTPKAEHCLRSQRLWYPHWLWRVARHLSQIFNGDEEAEPNLQPEAEEKISITLLLSLCLLSSLSRITPVPFSAQREFI